MKACRICLVSEAKFTPIKDQQMASFLEKIFNSEGFSQPLTSSHFVCLECKMLLRKTYNFIQKALNAQRHLFGSTESNQNITADNKYQGLNSSLSYHQVKIDVDIKDTRDDIVPVQPVLKREVDSEPSYDPLHGNQSGQTWNYSDFTDFGAFSNICKEEKNVIPTSSYHWLYAEEQGMNQNVLPEFEHKLEIEIIKQEVDDNVIDSSKSIGICKKSKRGKNKKKNVPPKQKKTPVRKKPRTRPVGVVISGKNVIEGKRSIGHCPKYSGAETKVKKEKRSESDEDYNPKMITGEESESSDSDTSYDENGKPKKKITDTREYPMKCDHCAYMITQKKDHYKHYLIYHTPEEYPYHNDKNFICCVCGVKKTNKNHLINHEKTHGKKDEKCDQCGKTFHNKKNLKRHIKFVHCDARLFCDFCNKGFKGRVDIIRHLRTHTGEKPYKCPVCGAGFAHSGNVKIHMNSAHAFPFSSEDAPGGTASGYQGKKRRIKSHVVVEDGVP